MSTESPTPQTPSDTAWQAAGVRQSNDFSEKCAIFT